MAKLALENEEFQFSDVELNHLTHEAVQRATNSTDEGIALPAADNWDLAMSFAEQVGLFEEHGAMIWKKTNDRATWVMRWRGGNCEDRTGPRCLCKAIIAVSMYPTEPQEEV